MADDITIRRAVCAADYRACQEAQLLAWGLSEESYVVPIATMAGAQLHGGLVLGAFLPDGRAVGLSFAFLGRIGGRVGLYSQLLGVIPGYQDQGVGSRLKQAQRDFARAEGWDVIAWAFDPLQAGNARFNLHKLGARGTRYVEDMYGQRTDALNRGVPTDRLIVEWETTPCERRDDGFRDGSFLVGGETDPELHWEVLDRQAPEILVQVPSDVTRLRSEGPDLAERWRRAVRDGFLAAFAAGYHAVDFVRVGPVDAYLLLRTPGSESVVSTQERSP
jgi:predicted GNAT superfamily acetyltransferase